MKWRLIEEESYNAAMNMAIDHAICESVANGRESPTIRFYKWINNSVSLGAYQDSRDISMDEYRKCDVEVVRRMTGGKTIFHDKNGFAYSLIAPLKFFNYSIENACKQVCYCIISSLNELGVKSSLENKDDIIVRKRKICSSASKLMDNGIFLQHGMLLYDVNFDEMSEVLGSQKYYMTFLLRHKKMSRNEICDALREQFTFGKEFKTEKISEYEMMRASNLAEKRYGSISLPNTFLNKGALLQ